MMANEHISDFIEMQWEEIQKYFTCLKPIEQFEYKWFGNFAHQN